MQLIFEAPRFARGFFYVEDPAGCLQYSDGYAILYFDCETNPQQ